MQLPRLVTCILAALILLLGLHATASADDREDCGNFALLEAEPERVVAACQRLAEQGHAEAQNNLGVMYGLGQGVPQDHAEAVKWYRLAAEQGHAKAQFNLGIKYDNGRGVPQDYAEAMKWYRKAAEQGYAEAQFNLGAMYANGQGAPQDHAEAVKWYSLAAEQGLAEAQNNLGIMYDNGRGVPQDYVQAHMWVNLAAAQGHENAIKVRDLIAQHMTPADVSKAQQLAREWMAKHRQ